MDNIQDYGATKGSIKKYCIPGGKEIADKKNFKKLDPQKMIHHNRGYNKITIALK